MDTRNNYDIRVDNVLSKTQNFLQVSLSLVQLLLTSINSPLRLDKLILPVFSLGGVGLSLFLTSALLGGAWVAYNPALSRPFVLMMLGGVGFFLLIAFDIIPVQWAARFVVIVAGIVAFYFVSQYAHFAYEEEVGVLARLGRVTGSLSPNIIFYTPHPNAVAGFLEGAFLLSLALTWQAHRYQRFFWSATILVMGYALLISASRGAWTGLVVALSLWALLKFTRRWPQFASLGIGLVAGLGLEVFVIAYLASPNPHIPLFSSIADTGESRLTLYRNSLALWGDYPFTGIGPGETFAMVYSRYQLLINVPYLYYAHNLFLSVGLGQGIVGLAGLGLMLVAFYRFVIQVESSIEPGNELRPLFRAAWLGVTASLIHGLTDSVQFSPDFWTMPMIFALAGITIAAGNKIKGKGAKTPGHKGLIIFPLRLCSPAPLLFLSIFVIAMIFFWRPLTAAWYANLGANYQTRAELSEVDETTRERLLAQAASYFKRTLVLNPTHPVANRRLGMMALDQNEFEVAAAYLEQSYVQQSYNQATLKALGYAYLWTGQLDTAYRLFQQVDFKSRLLEELNYWQWQWEVQGREDLAGYAEKMAQRIPDK